MRARADAIRALKHRTTGFAEQDGANIGPEEPTSMGAFCTTLYGPKIVGCPSLKAVSHLSATGYTALCGFKNHRKSYKLAAQSSAQSDQSFRCALTSNWQTRAQSFLIRTAESNQIELGAHAIIFWFCCLQVHISELLRNFITLVCVHKLKQTELKLHVFRQ